MSEKNVSENILNDESLENVNGGILDSRSYTDKKGLRLRTRVGFGVASTSESESEVAGLAAHTETGI